MSEQVEPVLVEHLDGGVARLTLNRPDVLNALDPAGLGQLRSTFSDVGGSDGVRVIVLTGAGRAFCAGLDVTAASAVHSREPTIAERLAVQEDFGSLITTVRALPVPVIAAVHGPAAGAGLALALAADVRLASADARFVPAAIALGLSSGECGTSYLLPRLVGASAAFEILLTGRAVSAPEALQLRLVSAVADDAAALVAAATEVANSIAVHPRLAVERTKALLWGNLDAPSLDAAMHLEALTQVLAGLTGDSQEAMRAFAERRPPRFTGR